MIEKLKKIIEGIIDGEVSSFLVEVPKMSGHGDYATNIALVLAKKNGKSPREVAQEIVQKLPQMDFIKKIEIAGPGFINFYLSDSFFVDALQKIDAHIGKNISLKKKKIIIEYTDPNPFKEFHIGHLMSNTIGESIARLFDFQGAMVKRANYFGDVGIHVAKALWGKMKHPTGSWQDGYVLGAKAYEDDEVTRQEIVALNKTIYERSDKYVNVLYDEGKKQSLAAFEEIYKILGTQFDYYIPESSVAHIGKKLVEEGLKRGIFETGEKGAVVFKGERVGLHTRVFINSEGLPTYEAKELALAEVKYKKYRYDQSVVVTGNEIKEYFKVLLSAMSQIFPELAQKTKHLPHGMMKLPEGKMSSRTGKIITGIFLLDEIKKAVLEKARDKSLDEKTIEQIAVGALKYSILKQSIGSDIIYDLEKSVSFEGDSGPYLQYAYVRAISILDKAKKEKIRPSFKKLIGEIGVLEKMLVRFPDVVASAGLDFEPHQISLYLIELAREFSAYYAQHKIVDATDSLSPYRVALVEKFSLIMKNGLWLLGIEAPHKM